MDLDRWAGCKKTSLVARDFSQDASEHAATKARKREKVIKNNNHRPAHMRLCEPNVRGHGDVACHLAVTGSGQLLGIAVRWARRV